MNLLLKYFIYPFQIICKVNNFILSDFFFFFRNRNQFWLPSANEGFLFCFCLLFCCCFFFFLSICLFIYLWLCWVFVPARGPSPVAASRGHSSSRYTGLSLLRPLLFWSTGSRRAGSATVAHRPSCSAARGILPDQGSNPCPLHWQADSQPLRHQRSPILSDFIAITV